MPIHDWTKVEAGIFHDFHSDWIQVIKHALLIAAQRMLNCELDLGLEFNGSAVSAV